MTLPRLLAILALALMLAACMQVQSTNAMEMGCAACTEMAIIEVVASRTTIGAEWDDAAQIAIDVLGRPPLPSGAIPQ